MPLLSMLFHLQNRTVFHFYEILIFSQLFGETFIMSLKSTTFPKELW